MKTLRIARLSAAALLISLGSAGAFAQEAPSGPLVAAPAPVATGSPLADAPALPALFEVPSLEAQVASGALPPIADRIPQHPSVVSFAGTDKEPGRYGGTLDMLGGSPKDTRTMVVYGYARLVGYDTDYKLVADLAERVDTEDEGRRFTIHLRPGHKWSDGAPFTSENFRYYWEDVANDPEVSRFGVPDALMVDGEKPKVEILDATTIRYSWSKPNAYFLPALAGAQPLEIWRPSHYLKQFHARYIGKEAAEKLAEAAEERNWVALHFKMDRSYRNDNLNLPSLQPWVLKTEPPSDRFIFQRNPFYHRIDSAGHQLPYIDTVAMTISSPSLIPAKAAAGETDLQGAYLAFANYTFLKQAEKRSDYQVRRWLSAKGSRVALYPNLNATDPQWKALFRNETFRRALSIAINRDDINNAIFYGLGVPGNNTVLKESPLYREEYRTKWAQYDPDLANRMLDEIGLTERDGAGRRLLPDGRPMQIVVETAGEEVEQTDVLELVRDDWRKIGIGLFIKPTQREVLYNRVKAGSTHMAVWGGLENALLDANMSPAELTPLNPEQFEWPAWGLWAQTRAQMGEEPDVPTVKQLMALKKEWDFSVDPARRRAIWDEMLPIWADQVFTIGIVSGVEQLVVVADRVKNVPSRGVYNFDPGAFLGIYRPDTFWLDGGEQVVVNADKPS